jgi:anti-sigma-K factor RskA
MANAAGSVAREAAPPAKGRSAKKKSRQANPLIAVGASLALLGVGAYAYLRWQPVPTSFESTLKAHSGLSFWSVQISKDGQHMTVRAPDLPSRPSGYHYQLWAWPEGGEPLSLVPLPVQGHAAYDLTPQMQQALRRAGRVAVIVEASGPKKGPPRVILIAPLETSTARL